MKITCIVGNSYLPIIAKANKRLGFELELYSTQRLDDQPDKLEDALKSCAESEMIFIHRGGDAIWDEIEPKMKLIGERIPIVCLGYDPSYWLLSTAPAEVVVTANAYLTYGGEGTSVTCSSTCVKSFCTWTMLLNHPFLCPGKERTIQTLLKPSRASTSI